jgi:hypothetical protein
MPRPTRASTSGRIDGNRANEGSETICRSRGRSGCGRRRCFVQASDSDTDVDPSNDAPRSYNDNQTTSDADSEAAVHHEFDAWNMYANDQLLLFTAMVALRQLMALEPPVFPARAVHVYE